MLFKHFLWDILNLKVDHWNFPQKTNLLIWKAARHVKLEVFQSQMGCSCKWLELTEGGYEIRLSWFSSRASELLPQPESVTAELKEKYTLISAWALHLMQIGRTLLCISLKQSYNGTHRREDLGQGLLMVISRGWVGTWSFILIQAENEECTTELEISQEMIFRREGG